MPVKTIAIGAVTATIILTGGAILFTPLVFSGRVAPGIQAGLHTLTGISTADLPAIVAALEQDIINQTVTLTLREQSVTRQLKQLGVTLDQDATRRAIEHKNVFAIIASESAVQPVAIISDNLLTKQVNADFSSVIHHPQNATLQLNQADNLVLIPSQPGEVVHTGALKEAIQTVIAAQNWSAVIPLMLQEKAAEVQDEETNTALTFARQLLTDGIDLTYADQIFTIKPYTIKRLLAFSEQVDPANFDNKILGVKLNSNELASYLTTTIIPALDQPAQNARFIMSADGRVEQFALPQAGRQLDLPATTASLAAKLAKHERIIPLAITVIEPAITDQTDINQLGITAKLATGESDFAGSPANRKHNIALGAARYHGLLIAPGAEFSFNEFLGPVNAAAGFKPELVIKENVTTPEFGGGLCQVSTTIFRAALNAGLAITQRRNHSYAVSYYGQPGLDATIYPPYTDLRFLNNTPGYILIQSRIEGTKLAFDFWGTNDDRTVTITGPVTYDRGGDGSVKAYVNQQVVLAGETIIDQTFYSRYKSPQLFPRVLAANDAATNEPRPAGQANNITPTAPPATAAPATPPPAVIPSVKSTLPTNEPTQTTLSDQAPSADH